MSANVLLYHCIKTIKIIHYGSDYYEVSCIENENSIIFKNVQHFHYIINTKIKTAINNKFSIIT